MIALGLSGICYLCEIQRCEFGCLGIICRRFCRSVDNRSEKIGHCRIFECLDYHLIADTICIAMCDSYFEFTF